MNKGYITADIVKTSLANLNKLTFEVTDACNLQCEYCAYGKLYGNYDERTNKNLSPATAKRLIDYLATLWASDYNMTTEKTVNVGFFGGEPLLNMPVVEEIVNYIDSLTIPRRRFSYSMTTNGIFLPRYMDFLARHRVKLLISLDGNEQGNSYRVNKAGKPIFDQLTRNIDLLRERYPDYFDELVNFNSVLHNRNSVEETYNYIRETYGKVPSITEMNDVGVTPENKEAFARMQRDLYDSLSESVKALEIDRAMELDSPALQQVSEYVFEYSGFVYKDYFELKFGKQPKSIPTGTCIPFSKGLFVTVNGKILPCEHIGQLFPLGWVNDTETHIDPDEIVDIYNHLLGKVVRQCGGCKIADRCNQCIFNLKDLAGAAICTNKYSAEKFKGYTDFSYQYLRENPTAYYQIMRDFVLE